ncbi:hypothetical protein ACQPX6_08305 [Actinomycetospora sp. CA-101289]|uniref:hypothetical protein n=1 Tax=Actinomycetospora sp. CA-101289 TaxID=3239893 RepID=UPI003D956B05
MSLLGLRTLGLRPAVQAQGSAPASAPPGRDLAADLRARDRLVELHVLAEHGDAAAAAEAREWLSDDPDARRIWHQVDAQCQELRADATDRVRPRPRGGPPRGHERRDVATPEG